MFFCDFHKSLPCFSPFFWRDFLLALVMSVKPLVYDQNIHIYCREVLSIQLTTVVMFGLLSFPVV